jgi:hypothetical protein
MQFVEDLLEGLTSIFGVLKADNLCNSLKAGLDQEFVSSYAIMVCKGDVGIGM